LRRFGSRSGVIEAYRTADPVSKAIVLAALLLVVWAYLPTLQYDYVTQDQWRAFRYSTEPQSALDRARACLKLIPEFYFLTGRPLVWMSECIEHAAVAKISDFAYLRPVVLALVLSTVAYLGYVLAPILGGLAIGILAAAWFSLTSAYSFMYLQGMTAGMVLITPILAAISFNYCSQRNLEPGTKLKSCAMSFCLFVAACLIYPAYAFIVLPLALLQFGFDVSERLSTRLQRLALVLVFYFCASLFYYAIVKAMVFLIALNVRPLPDLGGYEVTMQLGPAALLRQIKQAAIYFFYMQPIVLSSWTALSLVILLAFAGYLGWLASRARELSAFAMMTLYFLIGCIILFASISPWLFSKTEGVSARHVLTWNLFFCAATAGLFSMVLQRRFSTRVAAAILLLAGFLPIAWVQNRQSELEIAVAGSEIQLMRDRLSNWLGAKGWIDNRYLLAVLPTDPRPAKFEASVMPKYGNDNAVLASSQNPISIPWMVNALLRERPEYPDVRIGDCGSDQECAISALLNSKAVVVGYSHGAETFSTPVRPYVINFSLLTNHPIIPSVKFVGISASSVADDLGPAGLLWSVQPGWHAARNPDYPQTITLDFGQSRSFSKFSFQSQDGIPQRMPKEVRIKTSNDGTNWTPIASASDVCALDDPSSWRDVGISEPAQGRFMQVEILSNCGDPTFLTLKGLRVE
jgi:F5/8 type C domain